MANKIFGSLQGTAMRTTLLDTCGNYTAGPNQFATSDGFVSVGITANIDDGETFEVKTANGVKCINEKECPSLNWFDLAIEFCNTDPDLFSVMAASTSIVVDVQGDAVGYQVGEERICSNFALEIWTKVSGSSCGSSSCGPGGCERHIYWCLPWLTNGILGDYTIENGPLSVSWNGNTKANPQWGQGPYDVICLDNPAPTEPVSGSNPCGEPGPLGDTPVLPTTHLYKRLTCLPPPTITCGLQTLAPVDPVGSL